MFGVDLAMLYITGFKSPTSSSYTIVLWQSGSFVYCSKSRFSWALKAHRNRLSHNLRKTVSWNDEHFIYIHSLPVGKCIYKSFGEWSICNTMQQVGTSWYSLSNLRGSLKEYYCNICIPKIVYIFLRRRESDSTNDGSQIVSLRNRNN